MQIYTAASAFFAEALTVGLGNEWMCPRSWTDAGGRTVSCPAETQSTGVLAAVAHELGLALAEPGSCEREPDSRRFVHSYLTPVHYSSPTQASFLVVSMCADPTRRSFLREDEVHVELQGTRWTMTEARLRMIT